MPYRSTRSEQVTETMENLSNLISDVACIKGESCQTYSIAGNHILAHWQPVERLELVHGAIE